MPRTCCASSNVSPRLEEPTIELATLLEPYGVAEDDEEEEIEEDE